jgi:hypothetical protein
VIIINKRCSHEKYNEITKNHLSNYNSVENFDRYENMVAHNHVIAVNRNKSSRDSLTQRMRQKGAEELVKRMKEERNKRKRKRGITERKERERYSRSVKQHHEDWVRARDEKVGICDKYWGVLVGVIIAILLTLFVDVIFCYTL